MLFVLIFFEVDHHLAFSLLKLFPLTRIVLFRDFDENLVSGLQAEYPSEVETVPRSSRRVGRALLEASIRVEHFSASFIVDALHFFRAGKRPCVWKNLKSLALTSRLLSPNESHAEINDILQIAALAAMRMPKLKIMELWNGGKEVACVFRYQASQEYEPMKLTWRGNWTLFLEPCTIEAWEGVALRRNCRGVVVVKELLDTDVMIKSHGDAIHHLRLENQVVHPVSLWQIRRETNLLVTA